MISGLLLIKCAGLAVSLGTAYAAYRTMPVPAARSKMLQAFKLGDLCIKHKNRKGKEIKKYPLVSTVRIYHDCMRINFTIPDGLDPKEIIKNEWLFKQKFGENIDLKQGIKVFELIVYPEPMQTFNYNYSEISPLLGKLNIPIVAGKSRSGYEVYDMVEHPHLLIAGETGSGKSVELRQILTNLILSKKDIELYCADLKRSEFHLFRGIAKKVVVDPNKLMGVLQTIRKEMRRRGDMLDEAGLSNIMELPNRPPFIILAVDEFALLKKEKEIMEIVEEISAIGRALGVFLILSMQRPDADVLDGKLKNNLTVRMAFRHSDEINSRITIGSGDAAYIKPSEKGRMCFKLETIKQVQAPFLDLKQAKKLLEPFKKLDVVKEPREEIIEVLNDESEGQSNIIEFGMLSSDDEG